MKVFVAHKLIAHKLITHEFVALVFVGFAVLGIGASARIDDVMKLRGIVNKSYGVIEIDTCRDAVRLLGGTHLKRGQRVVLYQTLGRNRRPLWTTVDTTANGWVYITTSLQTPLDLAMGVQLVSVASARTASINGAVTCSAWDGIRGGVIAVECTDTLFINNVIDASARGFRGGSPGIALANRSHDDNSVDKAINQSGEGVERLSARKRVDKSMLSQGGGRGGARNGGGGGGGAASDGGQGGKQCFAIDSGYVGGRPGLAVALDDTNVETVFGGGGGAGHQNDHADSRGGHGAGIILIRAKTLVVPDTMVGIRARGEYGPAVSDDGGGGGGAGGTVVLDVDTVVGLLHVDVRGGDGGGTNGLLFCYGAGGGGSGGRILLTSSALRNSLVVRLDAGQGGQSGSDECPAEHHGAQGGVGEINVRQYRSERHRTPASVVATVVVNPICPGDVARLVLGPDTITTQPLYTSTWIAFAMQSADGCVYTDSVQVRVRRIEGFVLRSDTTITRGDSIVMNIPASYSFVEWSTGERSHRIVIRDSGTYWVRVVDNNGCTLPSDSMRVSVTARRPRIFVSVDDASGRPGDNVHAVVRARTDDTLSTPLRIEGSLSSQLSLLVPATREYRRSKRLSFVPVAMTLGTTGANATSLTIPYRCALGDADTSVLQLDSMRVYGADVIVERQGVFRLDGICRAGGTVRLFDPWGSALTIERVDDVTLRVNSNATVVGVFDVLGKRLDIASKAESNATLLTFGVAPAREIYLALIANGVTKTRVLWLR